MILQTHKAIAIKSRQATLTAFCRVGTEQNCPMRRSFLRGGRAWTRSQIALVDTKRLADQFRCICLRQNLPIPLSGCDIATPISSRDLRALTPLSFQRASRLQPTLTSNRYY